MLDTPIVLLDTEEADWAYLSPEGSVFEMDEKRRTPEREWTRLVQYNAGNGPVVLDMATPEGKEGLATLREMADNGTVFAIHNCLYDLRKLWKLGVYPKVIFDTLTASQMIWCGSVSTRHNLEAVIERETKLNPYNVIVQANAEASADALVATGKLRAEQREGYIASQVSLGKKVLQKSNWARETLTPEQVAYATADVGDEYWKTVQSLDRQLHTLGLQDQFALEMQILPIVALMSENGMKFNLNKWREYINEQTEIDKKLQEELHRQLDLWNQREFPQDYLITLKRKNPAPGKPARYSKKDGTCLREEVPAQLVGDLAKIQPRPVFIPRGEILPELFEREAGDTRIGGLIRQELGLDNNPAKELVSITKPLQLRKLFNKMLRVSGEGFDEDQVTSLLEKARQTGQDVVAAWLDDYQKEAKLRKLVSTYGKSYWKYADKNGYIHATFTTTAADTNRIQADKPNVLNLPRPMQKMLWCHEEGTAMLKCDYSAQEARLVFYLGNQMDIYNKLVGGMDLHSMTLSFKKGVPYDDLVIKTEGKKDKIKPDLDEERSDAKAGSFAPVYGAMAGKMAKTLGIKYKDAEKFMDNYWKTYAEVKKMQDSQAHKAVHLGYVTDLSFGRKRFFFKTQKNLDKLALGASLEDACYEMINPALNYAGQSTGATILRFALLRLTQMIKDHPEWEAVIRLTIHDAVLITCKLEFAEQCGEEMKRQMELAATEVVPGISVPVDLDIITDHTAPAEFEMEQDDYEQTAEEDPDADPLWEEYEAGSGEDLGALPGDCLPEESLGGHAQAGVRSAA